MGVTVDSSARGAAAPGATLREARRAWSDGGYDEALPQLAHSLCVVAVETIDFGLLHRVRNWTARMPWQPATMERRFFVLQNLGFGALLEGDGDEAWTRFMEALEIAPSSAIRVIAHAGLAAFARACGDTTGAVRHLRRALRLAEGVDWERQSPEVSVGLVQLALECARNEDDAAAWALYRYRTIAQASATAWARSDDPRVAALVAHATGLVSVRAGRRHAGSRELHRAARAWASLGYRFRVAETGADLWTMLGDDGWRERAAAAVSLAPKSWLARGLGAPAPGAAGLTRAERRVLLAICMGKRTKEIASDFGRSEHTIRNQTKRIFTVMGVSSRAGLVAACARDGTLRS